MVGNDFADIKFLSVKFSWGFDPHNQIFVGSELRTSVPHGIRAYEHPYTVCNFMPLYTVTAKYCGATWWIRWGIYSCLLQHGAHVDNNPFVTRHKARYSGKNLTSSTKLEVSLRNVFQCRQWRTVKVPHRFSAENFVKFATWFLTYGKGQTDGWTYRHVHRITSHPYQGRNNHSGPLASPAMGHWGTCTLDFQQLNIFTSSL